LDESLPFLREGVSFNESNFLRSSGCKRKLREREIKRVSKVNIIGARGRKKEKEREKERARARADKEGRAYIRFLSTILFTLIARCSLYN
jgi:hypothetical protein